MSQPLFSIITCTKNSQTYLRKCLESIENQEFSDYQQIIIDGKSSDDTLKILKAYSKNKNNILIKSVPAQGISHAMNQGIKEAQGKYLYFFHSDDMLASTTSLAEVASYCSHNDHLDWFYGQIQVINAKEQKLGKFPRYRIFQGRHPSLLKFYNYIPHQAAFVKKAVFQKFGNFDENLKTAMDPDFWSRIAPNTSWDYIPVTVAKFRVHSDSLSTSPQNRTPAQKEYYQVQARYLKGIDGYIAKLVNPITAFLNKKQF